MPSPRRPTSARGRTTRPPSRPSRSGGSTRASGPRRPPLPPSVYWRRRLFVLALAGSLVFVIASLLTGGSDGKSDEAPVAEQAGAQVEASTTVTAPSSSATAGKPAPRPTRPATPTLAAPEGTCDPADVVITPAVDKKAVAGRDVAIALSLQTIESEACTWQVAPDRVTVKITDGSQEIWTTRHCRSVVPTQPVVVRRTVATLVTLTWNARESAQGCRGATEWALPGDYAIAAAALGGEPVSAPFALASPAPETVYVTPKADPSKKATPRKKPSARQTKKPSR